MKNTIIATAAVIGGAIAAFSSITAIVLIKVDANDEINNIASYRLDAVENQCDDALEEIDRVTNERMKEYRSEHENRMRKMQEDHDAKMAAMQAEHEKNMREIQEKLETDIERHKNVMKHYEEYQDELDRIYNDTSLSPGDKLEAMFVHIHTFKKY